MSQDQNDHQADDQVARQAAHPAEVHQTVREDSTNTAPATDVFAAMDDYMNSTEVPKSDLESIPGSMPGVMPDSHPAPDQEALAASRPIPGATSPADPAELFPNTGSMALSQIPKERRPRPSTVCEVCPGSLWTASPHDVQCWCRIMHFTSWSTNAPYQRIACDGIAIASDQA
ncbi:hypothetical protein [Caballeronia sp. SBC2]|uniref:hypothetical protein n=1 Tax=Caballeronia sp. SBC2 TaxID=2705547 RepID=UPI0013E12994|nr:hypothetical protein [Caballeronia sp. SBC2]QIE29822.1 hypothetical protein SBC2_78980 [Caballeronia sp. SBC2]